MSEPILAMPWLLSLVWGAVGLLVAWQLSTRGHGHDVALTAIVAWPFVLPLLTARPTADGPHAARIEAAVAGVREALADAEADGPGAVADLDALAAALHRADARIARIQRLIPQGHAPVEEAAVALIAARDEAAADLEALIAGLVTLRLQVGRLALAGDPAPVGQRLGELRARVAALGELSDTLTSTR